MGGVFKTCVCAAFLVPFSEKSLCLKFQLKISIFGAFLAKNVKSASEARKLRKNHEKYNNYPFFFSKVCCSLNKGRCYVGPFDCVYKEF